jgi:hypothetical protein
MNHNSIYYDVHGLWTSTFLFDPCRDGLLQRLLVFDNSTRFIQYYFRTNLLVLSFSFRLGPCSGLRHEAHGYRLWYHEYTRYYCDYRIRRSGYHIPFRPWSWWVRVVLFGLYYRHLSILAIYRGQHGSARLPTGIFFMHHYLGNSTLPWHIMSHIQVTVHNLQRQSH